MRKRMGVHAVVEAGLAIALSIVLGLIVVYKMPQGGSVSAGAMVPILLLALRRGPVVGITAGLAYGVIHYFQDPYFVHPVQFLLDYPLSSACLGLAGLFRPRPVVGVLVGTLGRFASHLLSGVVFFASYAPKGMNPWVYSAVYNGSYLIPEFIIAALIIVAVWRVPAARGEGYRA
jgi:thiamine transporter